MPPKISYLAITLPTTNVNHTGLFKHAEKIEGFKKDNFQRQFYTPSYSSDGWMYYKVSKDKSSREHDEVISRCLDVMGLKKQFIVIDGERFVRIYGNFRTADLEEEKNVRHKLEEFICKFQRKREDLEITLITDRKMLNKAL